MDEFLNLSNDNLLSHRHYVIHIDSFSTNQNCHVCVIKKVISSDQILLLFHQMNKNTKTKPLTSKTIFLSIKDGLFLYLAHLRKFYQSLLAVQLARLAKRLGMEAVMVAYSRG